MCGLFSGSVGPWWRTILSTSLIAAATCCCGAHVSGECAGPVQSSPPDRVSNTGVGQPDYYPRGLSAYRTVEAAIPKVRAIYLKTLNMTAATNAPLYVGMAFFAPEVVSIMLGDKWLGPIDLLRLLAI